MLQGVRIALVAALSLALPALAQGDGPEEEILRCFADYRAAMLGDDGAAAAELVSSRSIEYFGEMQRLALYASSETVRLQSLTNQLQILTFRHRIDAEKLRSMSPKQLFAYTVSRGWTGKDGAIELELGEIRVEGDLASAEVLRNGHSTPIEYRYVREQNRWLWDLRPALEESNRGFELLATQRETDEESLLLSLVESTSGRKTPPTIWNPLFETPVEGSTP
jgi:hypothetical protein